MKYKDFTEFPVWKKGFELLLLIYEVTKKFPSEEKFGLVSDSRRSANSIVHNIAEGFGRYESRDKSRFYKISRGSAYELLSQALVSKALSYTDENICNNIAGKCKEIISELDSLIKTIGSPLPQS
jgi:four helix bundle protein